MKLNADKKVILMPFCIEAVLMYHKLTKQGIEVKGFFDNNVRLEFLSYCNMPIMIPHASDCLVIICKESLVDCLTEQLHNIGYEDEYIYNNSEVEYAYSDSDVVDLVNEREYLAIAPVEAVIGDNIADRNGKVRNPNGIIRIKEARIRAHRKDPFIMDTLDIKVTDRCTMKCKYCAAAIDYFKKGSGKDSDINTVLKDVETILSKVDYIRRVFVTGGETFLYSHLEELLSALASEKVQKKCGIIGAITNGTIVPSANTLRLLKASNIVLLISDYKKYVPHKKFKLTELITELNKWGIPYRIAALQEGWRDIQSIVDYADAEQKSLACSNIFCSPIERGRYYKCWFLLQAEKLGAIPFDEADSIAIESIDATTFEKYRNSVTPGCGWCKGHSWSQRTTELVPVAQQLDEPRPYKKYNET